MYIKNLSSISWLNAGIGGLVAGCFNPFSAGARAGVEMEGVRDGVEEEEEEEVEDITTIVLIIIIMFIYAEGTKPEGTVNKCSFVHYHF